jgi:hypothetical protein
MSMNEDMGLFATKSRRVVVFVLQENTETTAVRFIGQEMSSRDIEYSMDGTA